MLWVAMPDGEEHQAPGEILEELDALEALDADDVVAKAIAGEPAADGVRVDDAARRRVWLGLRLALLIAIGVVLIVAALFRYVVPGEPAEQPAAPGPATEQPQPAEPPAEVPAAPETAEMPAGDPGLAEAIQAQVGQIVKWRLEIDEDSISTPAFGPDGSLYVTAHSQADRSFSLYAIDPFGTVSWRHQFDGFIRTRTPLVGLDGTAYVYHFRGPVYAIDKHGEQRWEVDPGGEQMGMTLDPRRGTLYLAREGGSLLTEPDERKRKAHKSVLYAIGPRGKVSWERELPGKAVELSTPVGPDVYGQGLVMGPDGALYVSSRYGSGTPSSLRAYEPDGALKWQFDLAEKESAVFATVAFGSGGEVYAATKTGLTDRGSLYALDGGGGLRWVAEIDVVNYACPLLIEGGTVCIRCRPYEINKDTHQLRALSPADGSELWHVPGRGSEPVLAPDGTIYYPSHSGLMAITPEGTIRWQKDKLGGEPLIAPNGRIYVGGYAIDGDGRPLYRLPLTGGLTVDRAGNFYSISRKGEIIALRE